MMGDQDRSVAAKDILAVRAMRTELFPSELFDEFGWAILLTLFVASADNEMISERTLLDRVGVSTAAGQRWIRHLVNEGHIVLSDDGGDVMLSVSALAGLREFLDGAARIATRDFG